MLVITRTAGTVTNIDNIKLKISRIRKDSIDIIYGFKTLQKATLYPEDFINLGKKGRVILKAIVCSQARLAFDCPQNVSILRDNAHNKKK